MKTWLLPDLKNNGFADIPTDGTSIVRLSDKKYIMGNKTGEVVCLESLGDLMNPKIICRQNSPINKLQISRENKFVLVVSEGSSTIFTHY